MEKLLITIFWLLMSLISPQMGLEEIESFENMARDTK